MDWKFKLISSFTKMDLYIGDIKIKLWVIGKLKKIERKRMFECWIINIREIWIV